MNERYKNVVIITAGGSGKRLSAIKKKQFLEINGKFILDWTIQPFLAIDSIEKIIITLPSEDLNWYEKHVAEKFPQANILCLQGGKERQESVYLALQKCPTDTNLVLIHDGVRPFIKTEDIEMMLQQCESAIIPVSAIKYTLKEVKDGKILKTIPRNEIKEAHTPQIFAYSLIWKYHQKVRNRNIQFTDDASIMEYFGENVVAYEIHYNNLKITTQEDLVYAKYMLLHRRI